MTDIEWACKWVGWKWRGEGVVPLYDADASAPQSLPDLAEAVRVKLISTIEFRRDHRKTKNEGWGNPSTWALLAGIWLNNGPEAFISAVREVVDE